MDILVEKLETLVEIEYFDIDLHFNDDYLKFFQNSNNLMYLNRPEYYMGGLKRQLKGYVEDVCASKTDIFWAVLYKNELCGTLKLGSIDFFNSYADIGIMIGDDRLKGLGIGSYALRFAIKFGFETLGLNRLEGSCVASNLAMNKLFVNSGFCLEGRQLKKNLVEGKHVDRNFYGLLKSVYRQ